MNDVQLFISGAVAFKIAAKAFLNADRADVGGCFFWNAYYYNICLSFELSLKCFLAHSGFDPNTMKHKIGHDLMKGLDATIDNGFKPHSEDIKPLIEILGPPYRSHELRYLKNQPLILPHSEEQTLELLTKHLEAVVSQIGFDKSYATLKM
ncbi:MAG: hypothetical protein ABJ275_05500 [Maricaulaceae bacterium]